MFEISNVGGTLVALPQQDDQFGYIKGSVNNV